MTSYLNQPARTGMGFTPFGVVFWMPRPALTLSQLAKATSGSPLLIQPSVRTPRAERVTLTVQGMQVWAVKEIKDATAEYGPVIPISQNLSVFNPDGARFTGELVAFSFGLADDPAPLGCRQSVSGFIRFQGAQTSHPEFATALWVEVLGEAFVRPLIELGPLLFANNK